MILNVSPSNPFWLGVNKIYTPDFLYLLFLMLLDEVSTTLEDIKVPVPEVISPSDHLVVMQPMQALYDLRGF